MKSQGSRTGSLRVFETCARLHASVTYASGSEAERLGSLGTEEDRGGEGFPVTGRHGLVRKMHPGVRPSGDAPDSVISAAF